MTSEDRIKALARRCAECGLRLKTARHLLDTLMIADAIAIEGGNARAAARRLGIRRETVGRIMSTKRD